MSVTHEANKVRAARLKAGAVGFGTAAAPVAAAAGRGLALVLGAAAGALVKGVTSGAQQIRNDIYYAERARRAYQESLTQGRMEVQKSKKKAYPWLLGEIVHFERVAQDPGQPAGERRIAAARVKAFRGLRDRVEWEVAHPEEAAARKNAAAARIRAQYRATADGSRNAARKRSSNASSRSGQTARGKSRTSASSAVKSAASRSQKTKSSGGAAANRSGARKNATGNGRAAAAPNPHRLSNLWN